MSKKPLTETGRIQFDLQPHRPDDYARLKYLEHLRQKGKFADGMRELIDYKMTRSTTEQRFDEIKRMLEMVYERISSGTITFTPQERQQLKKTVVDLEDTVTFGV
jgi:hypothetical protein